MKKWFCGIFAAVLTLLLAVPAYAALPDGVGMITNCSHISGKEFSSKTSIAKKLDKMFAGDIGLYKDAKKTTLVNAALGTSNVPNNNVYQYWGPTPRAGTSCFAYANAFYGHFYDGVYPHHSLNSNHKVIKATGKITYKNFVKWGVRDDAAVYIREGNHSIIVLHYNEDYITYVDGNGNGKGLIAIRKEAWKRSKGANIYDQKPSLIVQPTTSYFAAGSMNSEKGKSCLEGGESHDWDEGEITKTASCKETGLRVYTCLDCGKQKEETLKKTTDHSYGEWTVSKEPTCTAKGKNVAVCSVCGGEKTKSVKALGHKYGKTTVVQEGTIWSPGITEKTCKTCGKVAKTKSDCIVESVEFGITFTTKEKVFPKKTTLTVVQPVTALTAPNPSSKALPARRCSSSRRAWWRKSGCSPRAVSAWRSRSHRILAPMLPFISSATEKWQPWRASPTRSPGSPARMWKALGCLRCATWMCPACRSLR